MSTIRKSSLIVKTGKLFSSSKRSKKRGGSPKSAKEVRSALFIMIKLKRGIRISLPHSGLQRLFKVLSVQTTNLVLLTRVRMTERSWCIKVSKTPILAVHRVPLIIFIRTTSISYLLVSHRHQAKMEVAAAEMLLSMKWWCKETFRCFNNNSKYCSPRSSLSSCKNSIFKITWYNLCLCHSSLVSNNLRWFIRQQAILLEVTELLLWIN